MSPRPTTPEREPVAWVLNLDAEHELESSGRYAPTRHLRTIVARERRRLIGALVQPGDLVLDDDVERGAARGLRGIAWAPTPTALARLQRADARSDEAPALEVLRAVNARAFAQEVRAHLVGDSFAKHVAATLDEALSLVARPAPLGWLVRRAFGAAGRGRRRLHAGRPERGEIDWLKASLRRGPLVIEPWVDVLCEYTRSGFVRRDGSVVISPPCFQETSAAGAWTRTQAAERGEVRRGDDERLEEAVARAGAGLAARGYFGPYGIDAFRHRGTSGARECLNPLSEINARLTMDWTTGMGVRVAELFASSPTRAPLGPR